MDNEKQALTAVTTRLETARQLQRVAASLTVTNNEQAGAVQQWLADAKVYRAEVDSQRREIVDPINASVKRINDLFREPLALLDGVIGSLATRLGEYALAAKEEQRKAFASASELHAKGDDTAARAALAVNNQAAAKVVPKGASVREKWVPEIYDPAAVPREYCTPNEIAIKALGRATPAAGQPPTIAGVRWVRAAEVRTRSR